MDVDAEGAQRPAVERTERMRRSRCASIASVASSATSSADGGGGPASTAARSPPRMRRSSTSARRAHVAPAAMGAAQRAPGHEIEGHQLHHAVGLAAGGALIEHRAGTLEDERLQEERRRHERRVCAGVGHGAEGAHQHGVEPGVGMALLGHLVRHLQERDAPRHAVEVLPNGAEGIHDLHLVHDVEVAPPLPQEQVHLGQRLQAAAELGGGLADALGHGAYLAVALGQEDDDLVGLAEAVGAQDDALVAEEAHVVAFASVVAGVASVRRAGSRGQ